MSMKMRRVSEEELFDRIAYAEVRDAIAFAIPEGEKRIVYQCPRFTGHCGVPFLPNRLPNGAGWTFDGNADSPTLTPSINCVGGCGWHGFITNGEMTSV